MRIFCRLTSKRRFVAIIEWLRLLPVPGLLLQITHTLDTAAEYSHTGHADRPRCCVACDATRPAGPAPPPGRHGARVAPQVQHGRAVPEACRQAPAAVAIASSSSGTGR